MLKVERVGADVSVLRMDDGRVNAIGPGFLRDFPGAWTEASAGGRAIVLAGNARVFCAGLDVKALAVMPPAEVEELARGFARAFRAPLEHPRPVVACVEGGAMAGGAVLALSADWRVASPEAKMGVTEVPVGVPFPRPVLELVRARLPPPEHAPALLQGVVRSGDDLAARGWAHAVVPREGALAEAVRVAKELAGHSELAFAAAKADLSAPLVDGWRAFEKEAGAWAATLQKDETRVALRRTLERMTRR